MSTSSRGQRCLGSSCRRAPASSPNITTCRRNGRRRAWRAAPPSSATADALFLPRRQLEHRIDDLLRRFAGEEVTGNGHDLAAVEAGEMLRGIFRERGDIDAVIGAM